MAKYLRVFVLSFSLILLFSNSVLAASEKQSKLDFDEIRQLHEKVYQLVLNGQGDEVDNLPEVKKYKEIFAANPELYAQYVDSLDVKKADKVTKRFGKGGAQKTIDGKDIYKMDDGSFFVLENKVQGATPIKAPSGRVGALGTHPTSEQWYNAYEGQSFTNDAVWSAWGVYQQVVMHLVTDYKIYSQTATITSVSAAGTSAVIPSTVSSSTSIINNNVRAVSSHGDYTQTDYIVYPLVPGKSWTYGITTNITVQYAGNGNIAFTAQSIVQD